MQMRDDMHHPEDMEPEDERAPGTGLHSDTSCTAVASDMRPPEQQPPEGGPSTREPYQC